MKKNVLALSIATMIGGLGFAGSASAALQVAESGAGHILLVPYYSAQEGNLSVFHLTNTDTKNGKAVKVRFRGASNSDDVLDFQVFLSPGDVWTGIVSKNPETGLANLLTADSTCTIPAIDAAKGQDFITKRLTRADWSEEDKAKETLEGYVEILNMADIPSLTTPASAVGKKGPNGAAGLFNAIKHGADGKPSCDTDVLWATLELDRDNGGNAAAVSTSGFLESDEAYYLTVKEVQNTEADMTRPTGGLTGQWYIMNLEQNTTFSGAMHAVTADSAKTFNVFSPQAEEPATLASADPLMNKLGADGNPLVPPQQYDVPDLSTPYDSDEAADPTDALEAAKQAEALTALLLRSEVINQFATDDNEKLSAKTDWVFSMPTRRYTIAANYNAKPTEAAYKVVNNGTDSPLTVAGNLFSTSANSSVNGKGQICADSGKTTFWDREEQTVTAPGKGPVFSPSTKPEAQAYTMCGEVGVLSFQTGTSALGASLTRQDVDAQYENGWGSVPFTKGQVPVLGAAFIKLTNTNLYNNADGVIANYGVTWPHTYK